MPNMMKTKRAAAVWTVAACWFLTAETLAAPVEVPGFTIAEKMISMRDGVKLHTVIYSPDKARYPLPILFQRTPYSADRRGTSLTGGLQELVDDGYIIVFQDIRGKFGSEGEFAMIRAPATPPTPRGSTRGPTLMTRSTG